MMTPLKIPRCVRCRLLLGILCACPFSAAGAESVNLSIGDAVRVAVEKNLGLQVATYSPPSPKPGSGRRARSTIRSFRPW